MSPWEACNTVPNTAKKAAAKVGEFFKGNPANLKGLRFLNIDQLRFAFQSMNFEPSREEIVLGNQDDLQRFVRILFRWTKGSFYVIFSEDRTTGNLPMVTVVEAWDISGKKKKRNGEWETDVPAGEHEMLRYGH